MKCKLDKLVLLIAMAAIITSCNPSAENQEKKIKIKVVVVSMFEAGKDEDDSPGEFQYWVENLPLQETIEFPQGYRDLRYNKELGVLGIVTGVGNTKAAVSINALGLDDRFDLTEAYWLVAGISGVDPHDAPTGAAVWADWIIDGDLSHQIDAREIPEGWTTGYIPLRKTEPYELPFPKEREVIAIELKPTLVQWAFELTKDVELTDNENIKNMREQYKGYKAAQMSPSVMIGTQLAASTYWHGEYFNSWANDWVNYWTESKGNFITSAMEEIGTWHSLERLDNINKVDKNRFLVLRTASNFTMQWPGISAYESLAGEKISGSGYSAYIPSLEAAYKVGSPVVLELCKNWAKYRTSLPTNESK
jgi:purine nucleoside permease